MHDWTLIAVQFEWKTAQVVLTLRNQTGQQSILASSVVDLHVPQLNEWGPSASVNEIKGPSPTPDGHQSIEVEMQSGDSIKVTAFSFEMPAS
jgi:hypothetical protein